MLKLIIGNKKYSSWSMRPLVALKHVGVPFEEQVIGLDRSDTADQIAKVNPAGRVPVLVDGELTVWDSLAICEYLAEKFPQARLWPEDARARAQARSACAEMHSSFQSLRNDMLMRILPAPLPPAKISAATQADIDRITALWTELRGKYGKSGPYLFGHFTNADAFYAPVAIGRFRTYSVPLSGVAKEYAAALAEAPAVKSWLDEAAKETLRVPRYEL